MNVFLMTFSPAMGFSFNPAIPTRDQVLEFLNTRSEVKNWYAAFDGGIVLVSFHDSNYLGALLRQKFPGMFFVLSRLYQSQAHGWMPKAFWDFIAAPKSSGRWPS